MTTVVLQQIDFLSYLNGLLIRFPLLVASSRIQRDSHRLPSRKTFAP